MFFEEPCCEKHPYISFPLIGDVAVGGGFPFALWKNQGFKFKSKPPVQTTN